MQDQIFQKYQHERKLGLFNKVLGGTTSARWDNKDELTTKEPSG